MLNETSANDPRTKLKRYEDIGTFLRKNLNVFIKLKQTRRPRSMIPEVQRPLKFQNYRIAVMGIRIQYRFQVRPGGFTLGKVDSDISALFR